MSDQLQTMIANMPEKTGKSLEGWFELLGAAQLAKHGEMMNLLKKDHGVSHGFANTIVQLFRKRDEGEVDLVAQQYQGKENLQPIYEKLKVEISGFGDDIDFAPKKAYVSVRRKKQFAIIQPSTKTRVDLGLNLKGTEPTGNLEASGSFNSMCSHRMRLSGMEDISADVLNWLRSAYEQAG